MWIVLGYHPIWHGARMNRILREFNQSSIWKTLLEPVFGKAIPQLAIAWKNVLPSVRSIAQRYAFSER